MQSPIEVPLSVFDKNTITRAFNKHFFEFMDDMIFIYPGNEVFRGARNSFDMFRRANPTSIIKVWYMFIYVPYKDVIEEGNFEFFVDKDYQQDLQKGTVNNMKRILDKIDSLREPIRNMDPVNKAHVMKYFSNLCKLSHAYEQYM
jgi:hypothetical protein